ncbi:MAG: hypothetical protein HQL31_06525, partial [Planctomycetes bacterium]|nr:hypothetical protein [Planctomycetota bacterium]
MKYPCRNREEGFAYLMVLLILLGLFSISSGFLFVMKFEKRAADAALKRSMAECASEAGINNVRLSMEILVTNHLKVNPDQATPNRLRLPIHAVNIGGAGSVETDSEVEAVFNSFRPNPDDRGSVIAGTTSTAMVVTGVAAGVYDVSEYTDAEATLQNGTPLLLYPFDTSAFGFKGDAGMEFQAEILPVNAKVNLNRCSSTLLENLVDYVIPSLGSVAGLGDGLLSARLLSGVSGATFDNYESIYSLHQQVAYYVRPKVARGAYEEHKDGWWKNAVRSNNWEPKTFDLENVSKLEPYVTVYPKVSETINDAEWVDLTAKGYLFDTWDAVNDRTATGNVPKWLPRGSILRAVTGVGNVYFKVDDQKSDLTDIKVTFDIRPALVPGDLVYLLKPTPIHINTASVQVIAAGLCGIKNGVSEISKEKALAAAYAIVGYRANALSLFGGPMNADIKFDLNAYPYIAEDTGTVETILRKDDRVIGGIFIYPNPAPGNVLRAGTGDLVDFKADPALTTLELGLIGNALRDTDTAETAVDLMDDMFFPAPFTFDLGSSSGDSNEGIFELKIDIAVRDSQTGEVLSRRRVKEEVIFDTGGYNSVVVSSAKDFSSGGKGMTGVKLDDNTASWNDEHMMVIPPLESNAPPGYRMADNFTVGGNFASGADISVSARDWGAQFKSGEDEYVRDLTYESGNDGTVFSPEEDRGEVGPFLISATIITPSADPITGIPGERVIAQVGTEDTANSLVLSIENKKLKAELGSALGVSTLTGSQDLRGNTLYHIMVNVAGGGNGLLSMVVNGDLDENATTDFLADSYTLHLLSGTDTFKEDAWDPASEGVAMGNLNYSVDVTNVTGIGALPVGTYLLMTANSTPDPLSSGDNSEIVKVTAILGPDSVTLEREFARCFQGTTQAVPGLISPNVIDWTGLQLSFRAIPRFLVEDNISNNAPSVLLTSSGNLVVNDGSGIAQAPNPDPAYDLLWHDPVGGNSVPVISALPKTGAWDLGIFENTALHPRIIYGKGSMMSRIPAAVSQLSIGSRPNLEVATYMNGCVLDFKVISRETGIPAIVDTVTGALGNKGVGLQFTFAGNLQPYTDWGHWAGHGIMVVGSRDKGVLTYTFGFPPGKTL